MRLCVVLGGGEFGVVAAATTTVATTTGVSSGGGRVGAGGGLFEGGGDEVGEGHIFLYISLILCLFVCLFWGDGEIDDKVMMMMGGGDDGGVKGIRSIYEGLWRCRRDVEGGMGNDRQWGRALSHDRAI